MVKYSLYPFLTCFVDVDICPPLDVVINKHANGLKKRTSHPAFITQGSRVLEPIHAGSVSSSYEPAQHC